MQQRSKIVEVEHSDIHVFRCAYLCVRSAFFFLFVCAFVLLFQFFLIFASAVINFPEHIYSDNYFFFTKVFSLFRLSTVCKTNYMFMLKLCDCDDSITVLLFIFTSFCTIKQSKC